MKGSNNTVIGFSKFHILEHFLKVKFDLGVLEVKKTLQMLKNTLRFYVKSWTQLNWEFSFIFNQFLEYDQIKKQVIINDEFNLKVISDLYFVISLL
jgi:hypothetical protein